MTTTQSTKKAGPVVGDKFRILCSNAAGATTLAVVEALAVTKLTDGRFRIAALRPGCESLAVHPGRMEFTVDRTGRDANDYVEPVR